MVLLLVKSHFPHGCNVFQETGDLRVFRYSHLALFAHYLLLVKYCIRLNSKISIPSITILCYSMHLSDSTYSKDK